MRKKQEVLDINKALELSIEFASVDPIEVEKALSYAEQKAQKREANNKAILERSEQKWREFTSIAARLDKAEREALRKSIVGSQEQALFAQEYAKKMVARMERKVARMEAEIELQKRREEESRMRKRMVIVNGSWIVVPKPNEIAHLIQEPILNFR
jgi:hypothetical protein